MERRRNAVGKISLHELRDVFLLFEQDAVSIRGDVDVKEIGDGPGFVFDILTRRQCRSEGSVQRGRAVVG
eukprot:3201576-Pleurochrysis_carterae.AAC.1